jgi:uncharacterized membrane protein YciS (DUF1049 family)
MVKVELNQNQFDALCSFVYNLGPGNFQKSTLLKMLNRNNFPAAATQFPLFVNGQDRRTKKWKRLPGLVKRRNEEMQLFLREPEVDEDVESFDKDLSAEVYVPDGTVQAGKATENKGALWDLVAWSQTFRAHLIGLGGVFTTLASELGKIGEKPLLMFGLGMITVAIIAGIYIKYRDTKQGR